MSPMRLIILLVAAAAAAGAALMVRNLSQRPAPAPAPQEAASNQAPEIVEEPKTPVLVATRDLAVGDLLLPGDVEWREWPEAQLNVNYFTKELAPTAMEDVANSVVRTAIYESEPVLPQKIVEKGETGYMAALLTPGMRAVSVEISTDSASGGFILPNDRVDVLLTYNVELEGADGTYDRPTTTTILENVRVLAIDQLFNSGSQFAIGSTATVELEPSQARLIVMAERLGTVSLALRSLRDAEPGGPTLARTDFLIDVMPFSEGSPPEPSSPARSSTREEQVTVYRNGQASVETPGGS